MAGALAFVDRWHLGDLASIVGLAIALVGFGATIWNTLKAKRAAEAAEVAVRQTREEMARLYATVDLAGLIERVDSLKTSHRAGEWASVSVQYGLLRRELIKLHARTTILSEGQQKVLQGTIQLLNLLEERAERTLASGIILDDVVELNKRITRQLNRLDQVLHELAAPRGGE
ncbi:MAG: hypothetical protein KDG89_11255 [Geminicoccaceae bacterium]|nr:hypothetical protein [Geminicoccaceae bacterium]